VIPNLEFALGTFLVFGLLPLILALTIERWFWRLPLFGKLIQKKLEWDAETVMLSGVTIKVFRETANMGAKVSVAHHLATAANDIKIQLGRAQYRAFIITFVGFGLVALAQSTSALSEPQITPAPAQVGSAASPDAHVAVSASPTETGTKRVDSRSLEVLLRIFMTYTLPVGAVALLIESFTLLFALFDQVRKYEELLDPERVSSRAR
jgi:hypothetical protein